MVPKVNKKLTAFIEEISPIIKKHSPKGLILVVGFNNDGDQIDEGANMIGDPKYLADLLGISLDQNPKFHALLHLLFDAHLYMKTLKKTNKRAD